MFCNLESVSVSLLFSAASNHIKLKITRGEISHVNAEEITLSVFSHWIQTEGRSSQTKTTFDCAEYNN